VEKVDIEIDSITEMAQVYQRACYGDISRMHRGQREETQQAFLAGLYEGIQMGKVFSDEAYAQATQELRGWLDKRIKELLARDKNNG
jgi:hypothetical protein